MISINAKEIYPCDQGKVGAAVSVLLALIARINFLSNRRFATTTKAPMLQAAAVREMTQLFITEKCYSLQIYSFSLK